MVEGLRHRVGRLLRGRHLGDADLMALIDRTSSHEHVAGCERCANRHAELLCAVTDRADNSEADAGFDDRRLAHQRTHILRRLERNHGPARVLPFPAAARAAVGLTTLGRRWVAAAAIGGLIVGIFTGGLLRHRASADREMLRPAIAEARRSPAAVVPADLRADELLLIELEDAVIARPRAAELYAIDELTPVAR
jgi:hypothetical protein